MVFNEKPVSYVETISINKIFSLFNTFSIINGINFSGNWYGPKLFEQFVLILEN